MATVIYGGNRELNLFLHGEPHQASLQFMRNQAAQIGQYIQQTGSQFAQTAIDVFENFYSDTALRHARVALAKVKTFFNDDKICELQSLSDFQNATSIMQRYVMSQPDFRKMYHDGRCSGYEGSYVDMFPGQVGEDDYNYRRVMNGIMQMEEPTEDEEHPGWHITVYSEELLPGDRELVIIEQVPILSSWGHQKYLLANFLDDLSSQTGELY